MDSITTRQNNDPVNSEAALNLCLQLWHQGGLTASKAALLLAAQVTVTTNNTAEKERR